MSDGNERGAIVSGIGISRIGRKTGISGIDLTVEAAGAAIADAGLRPEDIDAIATMGDTPAAEVQQALGLATSPLRAGGRPGGLLVAGDRARSSPSRAAGRGTCSSTARCR